MNKFEINQYDKDWICKEYFENDQTPKNIAIQLADSFDLFEDDEFYEVHKIVEEIIEMEKETRR